MTIRTATPHDAAALLSIYSPYVQKTAITFEYEPPSLGVFRARIVHTLQRYPYLVAEQGGRILGYAYASPFKDRPAYQYSVETSIYVDAALKRSGVGSRLHAALEEALAEQGILNMNACIAYPATDISRPLDEDDRDIPADPYLPADSVLFHRRMGYRTVAHFHRCGYKYRRWYDMIWMEKLIGDHSRVLPDLNK